MMNDDTPLNEFTIMPDTDEDIVELQTLRNIHRDHKTIPHKILARHALRVIETYIARIDTGYKGDSPIVTVHTTTEKPINDTDTGEAPAQGNAQQEGPTPQDIVKEYCEKTGARLNKHHRAALADLLHQIYKVGHQRGIMEAVQTMNRTLSLPPKSAH